MRSYTIQEAYDTILTKFSNGWVSSGYVVGNLRFDDSKGNLPDSDQTWARVNYKNIDSQKRSLSGFVNGASYVRSSLLTAQLFVPSGTGKRNSNKIGQEMLDLFEGGDTSLSAMWFTSIKVNEIGNDGPWLHSNLVVEIKYHQTK